MNNPEDIIKAYEQKILILEEELVMSDIYERVLLSSHRSVAVIGLDFKIIWINKTAEKMFGYELFELKGKKVSETLFGEETDISKVPEALENAIKGHVSVYEHILYKREKTKVWVRVHMHPMYDRNNQIDKICIYGTDITQEKAYQKQITESENRFKELLEHTSDLIYTIDISGNIISTNAAWERFTGYSIDETLHKHNSVFLHPKDVDKLKLASEDIISGKSYSFNKEIRCYTKNHEIVWLNTTCYPYYSATKEVIGFNGIAKNITEQKRNQCYYELLSKNVGDLICLLNNDSIYNFVSPSIKEIAGYEPDELIDKYSFTFYHPDDLRKAINYREQVLKNSNSQLESITLRFRKKNGTYTWLEITAKYFFDDFTDDYRTIISAKVADIRKIEEEKLNAKLEEEKRLNRIKSGFVDFVSHEFKTPLSIIKGLCELVNMSIDDKQIDIEQLRKDIKGIDFETRGLIDLIEDVLIIEKIENGKLSLQPRLVNIDTIISSVNDRLSTKLNNNRKAAIEINGPPVQIEGDPKYLEVVYKNLLSNAYKYSDGRPSPIVKIDFRDYEVLVTVKDFGIGIPEKSKAYLFTSFFRADNVTQIEGTGLGLSIVKKFVELHNGSVSCKSELGIGTEMIVRLPTKMV